MEKTIHAGGAEIRMRASALIPRLYRFKFGRDMIHDMKELEKAYKKALSIKDDATDEERQEAQLSAVDLTTFENLAWTMARAADPTIPDDPGDWLDTIDGTFSIYEVMPDIIELWASGLKTTSTAAKK